MNQSIDHAKPRVVVVTGAARGIGLACARRFAAGGDRVVLADRDMAACTAAAAMLGAPHLPLHMDVADEASVDHAMAQISAQHGPPDVLVNNAGIVDRFARPILEVPDGDLDNLVAINLEGPFLVTRAAVRAMSAKPSAAGSRHIINISSGAALRALPGRASYSLTKAGLIGMTRSLATELAAAGIAVNAVLPGYTDTEILLSLEREGRFDRVAACAAIPMGRLGRSEDIAEAVYHVSRSTYLAGSLLVVDGGVDAFGGSGKASTMPMPHRTVRAGDVACVTGGGSGMGAAIADRLAAAGFVVAVLDTHPYQAGRHPAWQVDVADVDAVEAAMADIARRLGPVSVLINNAGIVEPMAPTAAQPLDDFKRTLAVNLKGVVHMSRAAARQMIAHGGGAIVNLSSIAATLGLPARNAYGASKAAVTMLTRSLACEWACHGIRVNAVAPGYIATPAIDALVNAGTRDPGAIMRRIPMGRLGQPAEIAEHVAFLVSDTAAYITGTTLMADGGYSASGHPPGAPMP